MTGDVGHSAGGEVVDAPDVESELRVGYWIAVGIRGHHYVVLEVIDIAEQRERERPRGRRCVRTYPNDSGRCGSVNRTVGGIGECFECVGAGIGPSVEEHSGAGGVGRRLQLLWVGSCDIQRDGYVGFRRTGRVGNLRAEGDRLPDRVGGRGHIQRWEMGSLPNADARSPRRIAVRVYQRTHGQIRRSEATLIRDTHNLSGTEVPCRDDRRCSVERAVLNAWVVNAVLIIGVQSARRPNPRHGGGWNSNRGSVDRDVETGTAVVDVELTVDAQLELGGPSGNHKLPGRCTDGNGLDDCPVAIGERAREPDYSECWGS